MGRTKFVFFFLSNLGISDLSEHDSSAIYVDDTDGGQNESVVKLG